MYKSRGEVSTDNNKGNDCEVILFEQLRYGVL